MMNELINRTRRHIQLAENSGRFASWGVALIGLLILMNSIASMG